MNPVYIHIVLNHLPVIGVLFSIAILFYGISKKNQTATNIALVLIIFSSIMALPVFITGEPAEEVLEGMQGINKTSIEAHEDAAQPAFWLMEALGAFAIIVYIANVKNRLIASKLNLIALILSLVVFGFMTYTAKLGGEIRHTIPDTAINSNADAEEQGHD